MKWTDAEVAEFRERGCLFIESLFSPEEVGVLNAELPGILARRGPENLREQKSDAVRSAIAPHLYNEPFRRLSRHPRLIEPARQVLGGPVYLHQFKINAKRAHDGEICHWHQDYRTWYEDDGMLRPDIINAALFLVGMMLVGATIISRGLKIRLSGANLGIVLGVAAAYVLVFVRFTSTEERSHLIEYGVVAAFIHAALEERARQGRPVPFYPVLAVLATALIGVVDEFIQHFIPNRVFDPQDIFFNAIAGAIAVTAISALAWAQKRTHSSRPVPPRTDNERPSAN